MTKGAVPFCCEFQHVRISMAVLGGKNFTTQAAFPQSRIRCLTCVVIWPVCSSEGRFLEELGSTSPVLGE
jgi:hypothetical protein